MQREYLQIGFARDLRDLKDRRLFRFLEILPGVLSWATLLIVIFLSWQRPVWVAFFIITFDIYWLLKTLFLSLHQRTSFSRMRKNMKIDWLKELNDLRLTLNPEKSPAAINGAGERGSDKREPICRNWKDIYHLVILPMYKEKLEVVASTFQALVNSKYPLNRLIVVLATEERVGKPAQEIAQTIKKEFGNKFFCFLITTHPKDISGELAGKGSNETWAGRKAKEFIDSLNPVRDSKNKEKLQSGQISNGVKIPYENIIVSSFDIDTQVYPYYFACLTYHYLTCQNPLRSSFQPVPMYNNNIWDAPAISRVVAMGATFWHMIQQERAERMSTFSSHSMGFKAIVEMDFWPVKNVSEDSRIFWKALVFYNGKYQNVPLYYPVSMDANLAKNVFQTTINVFKQQTRWSWGVENVPYFTFGCIKNKAMALGKKIYHLFHHWEAFWSWATNSLLIFLLGWLPLFLGGEAFSATVLSYNLPRMTRLIMTLAMVGLVFSAFYALRLLPPRPVKYKKRKYIWMIVQWILVPIVMILFGALPALISQTRLMIGKYMGFWVTVKKRK